jgi:hypothetical protein
VATFDLMLEKLSRTHDGVDELVSRSRAQTIEREQARGVKPWHVFLPGPLPAATTFAFPPALPGFMWDLRVVAVILSAADAVNVFMGDPGSSGTAQFLNRPPVGGALSTAAITTQGVIVNYVNFASHAVILNPGERVVVATNTATITWAFLSANSVIAERVGAYIA